MGRKRRPMGSEVRECNKIYSSVEAERSGRSSVSSLAALLGVRGFIIRERTGFASIPYYFCVYETKLLIYFFSSIPFPIKLSDRLSSFSVAFPSTIQIVLLSI